jgi:hypothetical protein
MTIRLRSYLPYAVILPIAALLSVGGLTVAHHKDRNEHLTRRVIQCSILDNAGHLDYCSDLAH